MNVAAECMGFRCDQWARQDTLLPAEPFVADATVVKPLIGSGLAGGRFAFGDEKIHLMACGMTLRSMAMPQAAPTATELSEVCRRYGVYPL